MESMWGVVRNGSQIPNGRASFTLLGRESLGEERVWGKVKNSVLTSLRHPSGDVEKVFG